MNAGQQHGVHGWSYHGDLFGEIRSTQKNGAQDSHVYWHIASEVSCADLKQYFWSTWLSARLLFGFMLASWFLSMWISNAAATAMMMPVAEAALQQLKHVMTQHLKPIVTEIEPEVEETAIDEKQEQVELHSKSQR